MYQTNLVTLTGTRVHDVREANGNRKVLTIARLIKNVACLVSFRSLTEPEEAQCPPEQRRPRAQIIFIVGFQNLSNLTQYLRYHHYGENVPTN